MSVPYTYRVKFIPTSEYYYGVRYSKTCDPSDLWIVYFTSCKKIHKLIKEFGKDSFDVEIRKTFDTKEAAISWEERVTRKVIYWDNYMNANSGKAFNHSKSINGGIVAARRKLGIHAMTSEQKSIAGRKGGAALSERKREIGLTNREIEGHRTRARKISERRSLGDWTEKELAAKIAIAERRRAGDWTPAEKASQEKLAQRRRAADWSKKELAGFAKVSEKRKNGKWITNDTENKFISDALSAPTGWRFGFTRKGKGA